MAEIFNCTSIRENAILLNGLNIDKMNSEYTLYFDESGNNRCFWIKDGRYNVDPFTHFVLGGIVANDIIDFEYAKQRIGCNSTVQEIKTRNVCKGSFEDCLKDKKLENFLDLLIEKNWYVHFGVVELFYYAIVDIVDSVMDPDTDILQVKNELYRILRFNIDDTLNMMIRYNYPNIGDEHKKDFLVTCISILNDYIVNSGKANNLTYKLRLYFQLAQEKDELTFIQDEESGTFLRNFLHFYLRPIYMFKNSHLYFDEELNIQEIMQSTEVSLNGIVMDNYEFVNSKNNVMIQLSDVFVGILARYLRFVNTNILHVYDVIANFNEEQLTSYCKLNYILNTSVSMNPAFWDMFLCNDMRRIFTDLVERYNDYTWNHNDASS